MAVKTVFSKEEFGKILADYGFGDFKGFKPFKLGAVQTNVLLETASGKFVFRYYESRSKEYALFEMNVLEFLSECNYPCPAPIRNNHGKFLGTYKNKPFAIFKFMKGKHKKRVDAELIAQALGKLHKISQGYKPDYYLARDTYDPPSCLRSATVNAKKITSTSEAKRRLDWLKRELKKLELPSNMPKGVCHCDTHPSNFLYDKNKIVAVLDFDDASYTNLLYDIANMLYFWAWPNKKNLIFQKARTLLKEYKKYRTLTQIEKEHLFDVLKMVICMSIGWSIHETIEDHSNEKRKIEFLNNLGREEFYNKMFR